MKRETQNLTNMKFGKLTVIKRVKRFTKNNNPYYVWQCICDCQLCKSEDKREYVYNYTYDLIDGKVISCGCLISERNKQLFQKYNEYDLSGDYGIGYLENGEEFYFDLEDYDKIKK